MNRLQVGTFVPPEDGATLEHGTGLPLGKLPQPAVARFVELAGSLDGVHFTHDLDIGRSVIRNDRVWCGDLCLNDLDLYFWYAEIGRSPEGYSLEALKTLSLATKVVPNPFSFEVVLDKYRAHLALRRAGARVADTVLFDHRNVEAMARVMERWGRLVLKPRWGYFGRGVLLVDDFPTLRDVIGYLDSAMDGSSDHAFLAERFYENDLDDWVSTTVIGGSLLYGYRKKPTRRAPMRGGAWKVFDPTGLSGEVEFCNPSSAHVEEGLRAQKALGADIVGFDMVLHEGEPIIVDENAFPGLYPELLQAMGRDVAAELFHLVATALQGT